MANTDLSPQKIKLEITETAIIDNPEMAGVVIEELKSRQFKLAIDDFGIGYSSLSYLHQFPIQNLKIDQSFVRKLEVDKSIEPIIIAIVNLAHNLNMEVIAEGIETDSQSHKLQKFSCEMGQGYLFSKPLNVNQATKFVWQELINTRSMMAS